jgi:hypothetical protein
MAPRFNTQAEAQAAWREDAPRLQELGIDFSATAQSYIAEPWRNNIELALDAQPALQTSSNAAIPQFLTTLVDPAVIEILFSPVKAATIFGEVRKGTWVDETALFPVVEHTGDVSSYDDFVSNGRSNANTNWPARQSYLFQTVKEYGERELERAGRGRVNWAAELDKSAANNMMRFANKTYFFGVSGLQNYGLLNDPALGAALTPATKAAGGVAWFNGTAPTATANEVYNDLLAIFEQLVNQTAGLVDRESRLVLALAPSPAVALGFTNAFGLVVRNMLKEEFPNLRIETAVQYGAITTANPQGNAAGNLVQLHAESAEGQEVGYCAFNEKMRTHPVIRDLSSFKQKVTGGTWGSVIRMPILFASMVGV